MKIKFLYLLLSIFFGFERVNSYGLLETLEDYTMKAFDKVFLKPFVDLLDPRKYVKSIDKVAGGIVQNLVSRLNLGNEVLDVANSNVPEIITYHGYPIETHSVYTDDGYRIEIHRIPYDKNGKTSKRGVVILGHGILCSSACWIFLGPKRALPYILADLGYDVWLSNIRGNTYGRHHMSYNPDVDQEFWKFSFHEIGMYDFPAIIDYVLGITQEEQVFFIAHSVSTTAFYVMCSERPEYNRKIKAHISLAPAAHMKHTKNPFLYLMSQFVGTWDTIGHLLGQDEFLPEHQLLVRLGGAVCSLETINRFLCLNPLFILCGFNKNQMNTTLLPIIFGHTPAGTSLRLFSHYAQLVRNFRDRFQYFSHGLANPIHYGQLFPPEYSLARVTVPSFCFYASNDWLVSTRDAKKTCTELGNLETMFAVDEDKWNHNDFVFGMNAKEEVFDKIVYILDRYN